MERTRLGVDAASINAMHDAMGAVVFALALELTPEQRAGFARRLARLAQSKTSAGSTLAGTVLLDYALAAEMAFPN